MDYRWILKSRNLKRVFPKNYTQPSLNPVERSLLPTDINSILRQRNLRKKSIDCLRLSEFLFKTSSALLLRHYIATPKLKLIIYKAFNIIMESVNVLVNKACFPLLAALTTETAEV
ncbi:hypothetical protein CDAR_370331 [Caerostris darwini]|uniref:Uncharacterized protein n=1 Tax=Caerostris darwini TaxID=1538125 RepID=A0AAV4NNU8_9ARAC|nr:hypothetical protein CDAR_370331 [Caerostris darwini]